MGQNNGSKMDECVLCLVVVAAFEDRWLEKCDL